MNPFKVPISILDLVLVKQNQSVSSAIEESSGYIKIAEDLDFKRFWVAEHHNSKAIASSATAVVISYLAQHTSKIRVGAGGIMLPNHSPLQVAENFGTLAELYGKRIDLGLGRAPGTDGATSQALRRSLNDPIENYPRNVLEVINYLSKNPQGKVFAYPGRGTEVPVWILGSSTYSAQLAAQLGLPYSFASHFAPQQLEAAAEIYFTDFQPSELLKAPYFMPCINVVCAETEEKAQYLNTSALQFALSVIRRDGKTLQAPVENMDDLWTPQEKFLTQQMRKFSFVGTEKIVKAQMKDFINKYAASEIMITSYIYDTAERNKSLNLLMR